VRAILIGEAFSQLSLVKALTECATGRRAGLRLRKHEVRRKNMGELHTGGCHCGQMRYQFSGPLHDIAHCHCSICRRVSGGIVTTWITVPASAFEWMAGTPSRYKSSSTCVRYFCGNCGAQLALVTKLSPESIDVTIATLDHPEQAPAERHIWTDSRLPWLHLDEHLPGEAQEQL
jgi:hypothetical protein